MITTTGLTKRYGKVLAVDGLDLDVRSGDVYGFLGPNGSGKTTTVRMLLGLVLPTSGTVEVLGEPVPRRAPRGPHPGGTTLGGPPPDRPPSPPGQPPPLSTPPPRR